MISFGLITASSVGDIGLPANKWGSEKLIKMNMALGTLDALELP